MALNRSGVNAIAFKFIFGILLAIVTHQSLVPQYVTALASLSDKLLHLTGWGILAIAMRLAFPQVKSMWMLFIVLFGYSIAIEIGQIFVPGRSLDGLDIVSNGVGCGIGFCVSWSWMRKLKL